MSMFQRIAKAATMGAIAVLLTSPIAVAEQGGRLIAQHRDAMLRHASQLAVCDSVSHK